MKIGIALSGGGTRGLVHIGALQALEENGIRPDYVSGTSAGAVVGVLYAAGYSPAEMKAIARYRNLLRLFGIRVPSKGLARHIHLRKQLIKYLPGNSFDDLKKSFFVTVSNLNTGRVETWNSGPLIDLVVASSSVPVLFEPIRIDDQLYVDGGLIMNLPVTPLKSLCDVVIGINLVPQLELPMEELRSLVSVGYRCFDLAILNNIMPELAKCDVVIEPATIHYYGRFSFAQVGEMYEIGYTEALKHIDEIKACMR